MWQAIVFDLDDTLYPERDYVLSGFKAVAGWAELNLGIPSACGLRELTSLFEEGVRGDTFNLWLARRGLAPAAIVPDLLRVYREHEPELSAFAEVESVMSGLGGRYRLGLVSDGYLGVQQRKWKALGLEGYFDAVVFSDELGREHWKPSPRPFEAVLERLGAEACAAVYVADNPAKDFYGARALGMFTVRVRRPGGEYSSLDPEAPMHAPHVTLNCLTGLEERLSEGLIMR